MKIYRFHLKIVFKDLNLIDHDDIYQQVQIAISQTDPIAEVRLSPSGQPKWEIFKVSSLFDDFKSICLDIFFIMNAFFRYLKKE